MHIPDVHTVCSCTLNKLSTYIYRPLNLLWDQPIKKKKDTKLLLTMSSCGTCREASMAVSKGDDMIVLYRTGGKLLSFIKHLLFTNTRRNVTAKEILPKPLVLLYSSQWGGNIVIMTHQLKFDPHSVKQHKASITETSFSTSGRPV